MLVTQEALFGLKPSPQSSASLLTHNIEFPPLSATFSHVSPSRFEISSLKLGKKKSKDLCFRNLQRTIKPFKSPTKTRWPGHCLLLLASARRWLKVLEVTAQRSDVIGPAPPHLRPWQTKLGVVTVPDLRYWYSICFLLSPSLHTCCPWPPPQPVTATLWVLRARRATRPQASAPARMASLASPATAAPKVTSRAAPPWPPASVSHKHTQKNITVAGSKVVGVRTLTLGVLLTVNSTVWATSLGF